ncbi:MAG: phosphomethylpyrimidine synthase ThiC [Thermoanaerobacteraceae bacterium]|nr:phosphomethylpyrimidine synthase ThiC [Thermoanaerobacteraceae bacterium]
MQVMIEGPGHMPLNEIGPNILLEKKKAEAATVRPFTFWAGDRYHARDTTTSPVPSAGAIAAAHSADFLCYVTPAGEHLRLPTLEDMKEESLPPHCRPCRRHCQGHTRRPAVGRRHEAG